MENSVRKQLGSEPGRFRISNLQDESREALQAEIIRLRAYVKELERAADSDVLAPVYNRRAFLRELVRAQSVYQRHKIPTALILLDLDDFKNINTRYGHVLGDDIIVQVGQVLQNNIRDCDVVARLGSDDFAVLLFKCDAEETSRKAEQFTEAIASIGIDMPSNSLFISATWGATPVISGMTPERILATAAENLSRSKQLKKSKQ